MGLVRYGMSFMQIGLYNDHRELVPFNVERRNTLVIGSPRTGKTALLVRLALDDIYNGSPVVFVDPTGEAIDEILKSVPRSRQKDVLLFDPARQPFAFNIFDDILGNRQELFTSIVTETLKGLWFPKGDTSTPVFDMYLRAALATALSVNGTTFYSMEYILTDKNYRNELLGHITDTVIQQFWKLHEQLSDKDKRQKIDSTYNKLNAFAFSSNVRNVLDQKDNKLIFKDKICLIALRTNELGEQDACLLGALVLAMLYMENTPQTLYLDGSSFGTAILGKLLNNCPHVTTVLAVQFLDQIRRDFQPILLGGIGQIVTFRTSNRDAKILDVELNIKNKEQKTNELDPYRAYVGIDGLSRQVQTFLHSYPETHQTDKIKARCLSQCTAPLSVIHNRIARFVNE